MRAKRLLLLAVISLLAAGPVGGFFFGALWANDPDPNPIGRTVHGLMMAVLTPLYGGFPPRNEGGVGSSFNAWPQIAIAGLFIFGWLIYRDRRRSELK
jgi:hypothetical protein